MNQTLFAATSQGSAQTSADIFSKALLSRIRSEHPSSVWDYIEGSHSKPTYLQRCAQEFEKLTDQDRSRLLTQSSERTATFWSSMNSGI